MNVYEEISAFYESYRGEKLTIGSSVEGRRLFALHVGSPEGPQIVSQYAIHAREWVTALIALHHIERGVAKGGAWILPLMNPDGALLCEEGAASLSEERRERLLALNRDGDFRHFKANANAVDLNVNFDAHWGTGKSNVLRPSYANYIGPEPLSEPETQALRDFTLERKPAATLSWHTKGEEIYFQFHQKFSQKLRDKRLAKVLAKSTGYPLATLEGSAGGYKDWCIEKLKIPAFTIEVGPDSLPHPLGREALPDLLKRTKNALFDLSQAL